MGPVISGAQRDRCERFVALAEEQGGKVTTGGGRPAAFDRGKQHRADRARSARQRKPRRGGGDFGPVIGVLRTTTSTDAVRIANDSVYGLSAQVYGQDVAAATQSRPAGFAQGVVNVNTSLFSVYAPSGGYKQSGLGRERGADGISARSKR